jgi:hypothetical protein
MLKKLQLATNDPILAVFSGIGAAIGLAGLILFVVGIHGIICGSN